VKIEDARRPDRPKVWETNIILAFVHMSYSSFIMKIVMIRWMKMYRLNCFAIPKDAKNGI
jgi:hypothetical protein